MGKQVLPRGEIYFDPYDADGNLTGERFLGNAPSLTLTIETETLDHRSSTGPVLELDKRVVVSNTRSFAVTVDEPTDENLELWAQGDLTEHSQSSASAATETISGVKGGRHYQIGRTDDNPVGIRPVTSVGVTDSSGTPSYVEGTDYEVDLALGRIKILAGGSITDGDDIEVTYDAEAKTWSHIESSDQGPKKGAFRYVAYPAEGDPVDHYFPEAELAPAGDLQLIAENEWQQLPFDGNIIKKSNRAAHYIDGRPQ